MAMKEPKMMIHLDKVKEALPIQSDVAAEMSTVQGKTENALIVQIPLPDDELPDMLYVNDGIWKLLRYTIKDLLEDPPKASITMLSKLLGQAALNDSIIAEKLKLSQQGVKQPKRSGQYVEVTERKAKIHFDNLIELRGTEALQKFHKELENEAI